MAVDSEVWSAPQVPNWRNSPDGPQVVPLGGRPPDLGAFSVGRAHPGGLTPCPDNRWRGEEDRHFQTAAVLFGNW
jgi:hypothetical protein